MAMKPHPVTGVMINDVVEIHGPITDEERLTAKLLLAEGNARWLVGAILGRHPLAFNGTGRAPGYSRRKYGRQLSSAAARADVRQFGMDWMDEPPEDTGTN